MPGLIEPIISIISRAKENGQKLTTLAIMAIVNMCNYIDRFKDIYITKSGLMLCMEMLRSKDE